MPRNPDAQRCVYPGCGAWAVRGEQLCEAHRRSMGGTMRGAGDLVLPLLEALARGGREENLAFLDAELEQLQLARTMFLEWLRGMDEADALAPARFLRAWNDSVTRVVQLIKARRLVQGQGDRLDDIEEVLAALEGRYDVLGFGGDDGEIE